MLSTEFALKTAPLDRWAYPGGKSLHQSRPGGAQRLSELMVNSPELTDQLARAYREARVLVLGDRSPKLDAAFALHRDFQTIWTSVDRLDSRQSTRDTQLLEKA